MSDLLRTSPVLDELRDEDGAVVLQEKDGGHRVVRLSPLGQLIRELATEGISIEALVRELEARLGPSTQGDALDLTARAVSAMEADGLLHRAQSRDGRTRNESNVET